MTQGFICDRCGTQFFSAAVESIKDCPNCKAPEIRRLVPEEKKQAERHLWERTKWICSNPDCRFELHNNSDFAGIVCTACHKGRYGVDPPPDDIDAFLAELDEEMSALSKAMGLEPEDLVDDGSFALGLEPCSDCDECSAEDYLVKKHTYPESLKEKYKDVEKKIEETIRNTGEEVQKGNLLDEARKRNHTAYSGYRPGGLTVKRGPKEYCRWCTHWTRKAECFGYCRKHDVVRNVFHHCVDFFRNQWAKDKITRW